MGEDALERVMVDFVAHKYDVLLATTIIENGLDIPNANTIVINRADRYGLSQLYQLRGRVGRSDRRAYAYLLIPPEDALSPVAKKRLAAIREFSDLGSGFRVAALDLEIRGAGNLLGGEQSGHIEAVGFDMYMKLLEQTIKELKGEEIEDDVRATVNLRVDLRIDEPYIPDMNQRLTVYRRMAAVRSEDGAATDARGAPRPLRPAAGHDSESGRIRSIRLLADRVGIESIDREAQIVVLKFRPEAKLDPGVAVPVDSGAERHPADAAGYAEARFAQGSRVAPAAGQRRAAAPAVQGLLVDDPGNGRRGRAGFQPGRDSSALRPRTLARRGASSAVSPGCCAS